MAEKQKIMIVDDDTNISNLVSLYLKKECFDTICVDDGEKAVKEFESYKPDLVVLDIMLPGIDGYDLCRRINESDRFGKPQIIVITALENDELEKSIRDFGVCLYMKKPLNLVQLAENIKKLVEK